MNEQELRNKLKEYNWTSDKDYQIAIIAFRQLLLAHTAKDVLDARIDEQEHHIMMDGSNVDCQGCYNTIAANSDRLEDLQTQRNALDKEQL